MGWIEDSGIADLLSGVKDVAKSGLEMYGDYAKINNTFATAEAQNQIALQQVQTASAIANSRLKTEQLKAQYQLANAQAIYGSDVGLSNIGNIISRGNKSDNLMIWISVGGLIIAFLQYLRKK